MTGSVPLRVNALPFVVLRERFQHRKIKHCKIKRTSTVFLLTGSLCQILRRSVLLIVGSGVEKDSHLVVVSTHFLQYRIDGSTTDGEKFKGRPKIVWTARFLQHVLVRSATPEKKVKLIGI